MTTIPNIIPDHTSSHLHKTVFTGFACGYMGPYIGITLLQGATFGLVSKGLSSAATYYLNKKFGISKVNEVVCDILGGCVFLGLAKAGFISYTAATFFTGVSIGVTLITIKVVYVAFSTFFFTAISDNGLLDHIGNYLSQHLFNSSLLMYSHTVLNYLFESSNKLEIRKRLPLENRSLFEKIESASSLFASRNGVKIDNSNVTYEMELTNYLTWLFRVFMVIGKPVELIPYLPFISASGILFKAGALVFDSSTRKNYWKLYQLNLSEIEPILSIPNSTTFGNGDPHNEEKSALKPLPLDMLVQIASKLPYNNAIAFFITCRKMYGCVPSYLNLPQAKKACIERSFPPEFSTVVQNFPLDSMRKMNTHLVRTQYIDSGVHMTFDAVQKIHSFMKEGGFELGVGRQRLKGGPSISSFKLEHMGERKLVWGYSPIPFVAVHIRREKYESDLPLWKLYGTLLQSLFFGIESKVETTESVILYHRCGKMNDKEIWGISDPTSTEVMLATNDEKFKKLIQHFKYIIDHVKNNPDKPFERGREFAFL